MDKAINNAICSFQAKLSAKFGANASQTINGVRELNEALKNAKSRFDLIAIEEKITKKYGV